MKRLIHAPLFKSALAFLLGILAFLTFGSNTCWLAVPLAGALAMAWYQRAHAFRSEQWQDLALLLVFGLLGSGYSQLRSWQPGREPVESLVSQRTTLIGIVARPPKATPYGYYTWLEARASLCDGVLQPLTGTCVAYLGKGQDAGFDVGDTLLVGADLSLASSRNAGYLSYLHSQGIFTSARVREYEVKPMARRSWLHHLELLRLTLSANMEKVVPEGGRRGIAQAMLLGDKGDIPAELKQQYARTGLSHILAVSGLHVGVIFLGLGMMLSPLQSSGRGRKMQPWLLLSALLLYMLLAGAGAAVVRAVVMFGLILVLKSARQKAHLLTALGFSAWVQMLWDPQIVMDVGFQLSYAAVLGIFWLLPWLEKQWPDDAPYLLKQVYSGLGVTISATVFTTPLVLAYFGTFPTWFLLSNLLVTFLGFPLILTGFFTLLVVGLSPWEAPGYWMGELFGRLLSWLNDWVALVDSLPYAQLTTENATFAHGWIIGGQLLLAFALFKMPVWWKEIHSPSRPDKARAWG